MPGPLDPAQPVQPTALSRWCLVSEADASWRCWGNEYVVHHALSNDTHRLSRLAGALLSVLRQHGSLDADALARQCAVHGDEVAETLAALEELDLVARC
jgi:PqqD family protein of HPr-rel-A system